MRMPLMTPQRLTPSTHSQVSVGVSHDSPPLPTPALLQTTWTPPKRATAASASACTCAGSLTSVTTPSTSTPAPRQFGDRGVERGDLDVTDDDAHPLARRTAAPARDRYRSRRR